MRDDKENIFRSVIQKLKESNQNQINELFDFQLKMNEIYHHAYMIEGNEEIKNKILKVSSPV